MCGVVVLWDETLVADELVRQTRRATDRLSHRGPDGEGVYLAPFGRVALGHRRLAIRGLGEQGAQPMVDPDGAGVLSYNGELFGAESLYAELRREGAVFRGTSDTEILSHALARFGVRRTLERISGQFAFAWLDLRERKLHLARDRIGIRTLYFAERRGRLVVASEQKALLLFPWVETRPRITSMLRFVALGRTDDVPRETLLEAVQVLPAAHHAVWDGHELTIERYWRMPVTPRTTGPKELRRALDQAITEQLVSDVPIGATLSGGLDSSTVVLLADRKRVELGTTDTLHIYAYHDARAEADERAYQQAVIAELKSPHEVHFISSSPERFKGELERYIDHQEEPFQDLSSYAEYTIARHAAQDGVKVLLNGIGGDEVFLGYPAYFGPLLRQLLQHAEPRAAFDLLVAAGDIVGGSKLTARRNVVLAAAYHSLPPPLRNALTAVRAGYKSGVRGRALGLGAKDAFRSWHRADGEHGTNARLRGSIESDTIPRYLAHSDRLCLAFGVEGREPLLDPALIASAFGTPVGERLSRRGLKESLRSAVGEVLPPLVRDRTWKLGFHAPLSPYLAAAEELLRPGHALVADILEVRASWDSLDPATRWRFGALGTYLRWAEARGGTLTERV